MPAPQAPPPIALRIATLMLASLIVGIGEGRASEPFAAVPLESRITRVQPMTGIVLWATSQHNRTSAVQLEYSYMKYSDVVQERGQYDWNVLDRLLDRVAARRHQAIVRFYFVYPGSPTTVPGYIKALSDYHETRGMSEGKPTGFPDWTHPELKRFTLEFYERMAARYDDDPRLAFIETGFGLWAEYHIYDGPMRLGQTFPDKVFQAAFARHLGRVFRKTPWLISIDAAAGSRAPFASHRDLLRIPFGVFDDSFLCRQHARENEPNWNFFGRDRWKRAPAGGEISSYTTQDQKHALAANGPHGIPFEKAAADFHITFMIANDQPRYQPIDRIRAAGLACGYKFRILAFEAGPTQARLTITNTGVAPIYHDAYLALNGVPAARSLKGLLPGESRTDEIGAGGPSPKLTIVCDRLVPGQTIEFEAHLPAARGFQAVPASAAGSASAPPREPSYRWIKVTDRAAFAPRDGAGALVYRGRMWLLGGWNPGDKEHFPRVCNNEVWSSADGATWTLIKPNTFVRSRSAPPADWEGRHTAGYAGFRDWMWIIGGDANQGHYQDDVWNSEDGRHWTLASGGRPVPWAPRALHYTLVFHDKIWVMGGQTMPAFAPAREVFYRDIWTSADGDRWERVHPEEPCWPARGMIGGSVVFADRIWILGGGTYDTPQTPERRFYNDVWSSTDGVHWKRHVEHAPWKPRQYHDVAVFDGRMWVLEGYAGANRNDVWHSTDGVTWQELPGTPWKPRHAASVFVFDGSLWVVAGNNMEPDVWKLVRPFAPRR